MTPAGKLQQLIDLYECGYLCKCARYEYREIDDAKYGTVHIKELQHKSDCQGRAEMLKLLNAKEDYK